MKRNLVNFALFQLFWFAAVGGAAAGHLWAGPLAALAFLCVHLRVIESARERRAELVYALAVGLVGALADSGLRAVGAIAYPTSASWPLATAPPWIASLWVAFALLPRFSLRWLAGRPALAAVLGAVGGPLSFLAGTRLGAVAVGDSPLLTWSALTIEYALITPLLLRWAPRANRPD